MKYESRLVSALLTLISRKEVLEFFTECETCNVFEFARIEQMPATGFAFHDVDVALCWEFDFDHHLVVSRATKVFCFDPRVSSFSRANVNRLCSIIASLQRSQLLRVKPHRTAAFAAIEGDAVRDDLGHGLAILRALEREAAGVFWLRWS